MLGQPSLAQLPFGDALEPGPLEVVGFDAPLGRGLLGQEALKHPLGHPHHATVLADLDPEVQGLPLGIPAGVLPWRRINPCDGEKGPRL